jgi:xanthosine phosphorylase
VSWREAAQVLERRGGARPRVGVVLGSGLGMVAEAVREPVEVGYEELPGFPRPTVEGHGGRVVLGAVAGKSAPV